MRARVPARDPRRVERRERQRQGLTFGGTIEPEHPHEPENVGSVPAGPPVHGFPEGGTRHSHQHAHQPKRLYASCRLAGAMSDVESLLDATRLFLRRHEEALASGDPARGLDACDGLIEVIESTLPGELARRADATPRHAEARMVLDRRLSEVEGLARQLKLAFHQLQERNVDVLRLVALLTATRRQLRALEMALDLWAAEHAGPTPRAPPALDALRAAREALVAGCAAAAREAIAEAAARAGVPPPAPAQDLVAAWRALDETEMAIHRKQMGR